MEFGMIFPPAIIRDTEGRQWRVTIHEAADLIPPMTAVELAELEASVSQDGQKETIYVVDAKEVSGIWTGQVLDGRNRLIACIDLGRPVNIKIVETDEAGKRAAKTLGGFFKFSQNAP